MSQDATDPRVRRLAACIHTQLEAGDWGMLDPVWFLEASELEALPPPLYDDPEDYYEERQHVALYQALEEALARFDRDEKP